MLSHPFSPTPTPNSDLTGKGWVSGMIVLRSSLQFCDFVQKCCCEFFAVIEDRSVSHKMCGLGLDHMVGTHSDNVLTKIMIS